jgi:hypothetical protein
MLHTCISCPEGWSVVVGGALTHTHTHPTCRVCCSLPAALLLVVLQLFRQCECVMSLLALDELLFVLLLFCYCHWMNCCLFVMVHLYIHTSLLAGCREGCTVHAGCCLCLLASCGCLPSRSSGGGQQPAPFPAHIAALSIVSICTWFTASCALQLVGPSVR